MKNIEYEYDCPSECTSQWPHEVNLVSSFLHMHKIGSRIWTTLWRNDSYIDLVDRIDYWDFNFQQQHTINVTVKPGDRLNVHCTYDTR